MPTTRLPNYAYDTTDADRLIRADREMHPPLLPIPAPPAVAGVNGAGPPIRMSRERWLRLLRDYAACPDGLAWAEGQDDPKAAWEDGEPDDSRFAFIACRLRLTTAARMVYIRVGRLAAERAETAAFRELAGLTFDLLERIDYPPGRPQLTGTAEAVVTEHAYDAVTRQTDGARGVARPAVMSAIAQCISISLISNQPFAAAMQAGVPADDIRRAILAEIPYDRLEEAALREAAGE